MSVKDKIVSAVHEGGSGPRGERIGPEILKWSPRGVSGEKRFPRKESEKKRGDTAVCQRTSRRKGSGGGGRRRKGRGGGGWERFKKFG